MSFCLCTKCAWCRDLRNTGNKRAEYYCLHSNRHHIHLYFAEHDIHKAEGFIGFEKTDHSFPVKNTPKWCPRLI